MGVFRYLQRGPDLANTLADERAFADFTEFRDREIEEFLNKAFKAGNGAPTVAGAVGDYYFRQDTPGTVGQRIYVCTVAGSAGAATWVATAA